MQGFFRGSAVALVTPFTEDGVNYDALEELLGFQIANGTDAVVLLGTTGEAATMTEEEKLSALAFAKDFLAGRCLLIAGAGGNCTKSVLSFAEKAAPLSDGLLAVTPYYNKCTQAGLVSYYREICDAAGIPVIAYNVPSRTGVNILPMTMGEISCLPLIAGIKEASGDMAQVIETLQAIGTGCDLFSGDDLLNLPILCCGGKGVISVVANLMPAAVKSLCTAVASEDLAEAKRQADALYPLCRTCFAEVNPIPVKAALSKMGFAVGDPRPPLTPLTPDHLSSLLFAMHACGLETV